MLDSDLGELKDISSFPLPINKPEPAKERSLESYTVFRIF